MSKVLIKKSNLSEYIDTKNKIIKIKPNMLITPLAKDEIINKNIKIIFESENKKSENEKSKSPQEKTRPDTEKPSQNENISLDKKIKQILRKDYNMVREADVQIISKRVLEAINQNKGEC